MSCVIVVTPLVMAGWPVLTTAISAAIGTLGYAVVRGDGATQRRRTNTKTRTVIDVEDSEILEGTGGADEEMVVERDGVRAVFSRDARGALRVCMEGDDCSKADLRRLGEELIGSVTQQYVYNRLVTELKERNMAIVDEEVEPDRTVKIRVRNL